MLMNQLSCFFFKDIHFRSISIDETKLYTQPNTDSLLGCFYILKHGITQYERNVHIMKDFDVSFKYECMDYITKNKKKVNSFHKKFSSIHFITILSSNTHIDIETFFMLCYLYDISITYIHELLFYSTAYPCESSTYIKVLCKTNDFKNKTISYHIENIPYTSISWENMYQITSITYPLPDITKISKEQLMHILSTFCSNKEKTHHNITNKRDLYECVNSLLKLI
jgi:hypothetical protein